MNAAYADYAQRFVQKNSIPPVCFWKFAAFVLRMETLIHPPIAKFSLMRN